MKGLSTILLFIGLFIAIDTTRATNYYFSSSLGDDSRISLQAQNPLTPWKTLEKLNSFFNKLKPGDSVLFNRGDIFFGSIIVSKSGNSSASIVLGAYGSGAKPIITGFTKVSSWESIGGSMYESTFASALPTLNMVTLNGTFQAIARWPKSGAVNSGYLTYQSHNGNSSITSNAIANIPNFTGGEVVIRKQHWIIDRHLITNQTSTTINYKNSGIYSSQNGYGFFFQNHVSACSALGDWCYDPSSKKIKIFFGTNNPAFYTIQASCINNLVIVSSESYITFDNLAFTGSNSRTFNISNSNKVTINACSISYSGIDAIVTNENSNHVTLSNSSISFTNNNAIAANESKNWIIQNNTISNTGMIAGMGQSGDGTYFTTQDIGSSSIIQGNDISNCGYIGLSYEGNDITIQNNYIHNFCVIKDDGAAIYTGRQTVYINRKVLNNIILTGGNEGIVDNGTTSSGSSYGIYVDQGSQNVEIRGNTVASCHGGGLHLNSASNIQIINNTLFDNLKGFDYSTYSEPGIPIRNITQTGNIFFAKLTTQLIGWAYIKSGSPVNTWGNWDNNYYCRPLLESPGINTKGCYGISCTKGIIQMAIDGVGTKDYSVDVWKTVSSQDKYSKKTPKTVSNINEIRFEFNATSSNKFINLGATYIGIDSVIYQGTITLAPYSSVILIYLSGVVKNQPPIADAGPNQNFFLPINSTKLLGNGSDSDGTVTSYQWTKISGPDQFTIVSPNLAQTEITDLIDGIYLFELEVTDDLYAVGKDTVTITVNPPIPNLPPIANAGADQSIILPLNIIKLIGSGSDSDGTITSYQWTKISGPDQFTIVSPNLAQTEIIDLIQGVYVFELQVTDNLSSIGKDSVTIIVTSNTDTLDQPSTLNKNQPPVANAGLDINMTLPTNTVLLIGSGEDADGTIVSYHWTKISGPRQFDILSANQAQTLINSFLQGIYKFELEVTDNLGAVGKDTVVIIVNPAFPDQFLFTRRNHDLSATLTPTDTVVYPNPATEIINIKINNLLGSESNTRVNASEDISTTIKIYNSIGILMHQEYISKNQQSIIMQIDIRNYPPGIYFMKYGLKSENALKFIKQ